MSGRSSLPNKHKFKLCYHCSNLEFNEFFGLFFDVFVLHSCWQEDISHGIGTNCEGLFFWLENKQSLIYWSCCIYLLQFRDWIVCADDRPCLEYEERVFQIQSKVREDLKWPFRAISFCKRVRFFFRSKSYPGLYKSHPNKSNNGFWVLVRITPKLRSV